MSSLEGRVAVVTGGGFLRQRRIPLCTGPTLMVDGGQTKAIWQVE